MDDQGESRAWTGSRPFQHLLVAIGVAERRDRAAADVFVDANRLAALIVDEIHFRQTHQHRLGVAHFILRFDTDAHHFLRRDAISLFVSCSLVIYVYTDNYYGLSS